MCYGQPSKKAIYVGLVFVIHPALRCLTQKNKLFFHPPTAGAVSQMQAQKKALAQGQIAFKLFGGKAARLFAANHFSFLKTIRCDFDTLVA